MNLELKPPAELPCFRCQLSVAMLIVLPASTTKSLSVQETWKSCGCGVSSEACMPQQHQPACLPAMSDGFPCNRVEERRGGGMQRWEIWAYLISYTSWGCESGPKTSSRASSPGAGQEAAAAAHNLDKTEEAEAKAVQGKQAAKKRNPGWGQSAAARWNNLEHCNLRAAKTTPVRTGAQPRRTLVEAFEAYSLTQVGCIPDCPGCHWSFLFSFSFSFYAFLYYFSLLF